jgi:hypothetical protein
MAGTSLAAALGRSSSIGIAAQSMGLGGSAADVDAVVGPVAVGSPLRVTSALVGSGGAGASGTTMGAALASDEVDGGSPATRLSAVAAGRVNQALTRAAPTSKVATPARTKGRFAREGAAASDLGQLSLPVIPRP